MEDGCGIVFRIRANEADGELLSIEIACNREYPMYSPDSPGAIDQRLVRLTESIIADALEKMKDRCGIALPTRKVVDDVIHSGGGVFRVGGPEVVALYEHSRLKTALVVEQKGPTDGIRL